MTFKGATYSSILDLETLIIVWEANLKACQIELKYLSVVRDKNGIAEIGVKINCYEKGLEELNKLEKNLIEKMEAIAEGMNDLESRVFIGKFIDGKDNTSLMNELGVSLPTLYRYYDSIEKQLEETQYGKDIRESLRE